MSQHYSNPARESSPYSLPDVEIFKASFAYCEECSSLVFSSETMHEPCEECGKPTELNNQGWFWQPCYPGCLPDSEPFGPFETEAEALADARDGIED